MMATATTGTLLICGVFAISVATHLSMPISAVFGAIGGGMLMAVMILTNRRVK